jgi:hypothetical protein
MFGLKRQEILSGKKSTINIIINVKKDEVGEECSTHWRDVHVEFWREQDL